VLEIDRHRDAVAGTARILDWVAGDDFLAPRIEVVSRDGVMVIVEQRAAPCPAGTDGDLEMRRESFGHGFVSQDGHRSGTGGVLDGGQPGGVLLIALARPPAGLRSCIRPIDAVGRVVLAGHRIAHAEAGTVLNRQPGVQQARQFDDDEENHQHHGQDQGKLDDRLAAEASPVSPAEQAWTGWHPIHR